MRECPIATYYYKKQKNDALIRNLISNDDIEEDTVWKFYGFSVIQIFYVKSILEVLKMLFSPFFGALNLEDVMIFSSQKVQK